jgi:hypothetical protein
LVASSRQTAQPFASVAPARQPFDPATARVSIAPGPGGGTEFRFGANRTPGAAFAVTIMAVVFSGVAFGIRYLGAPLVFPIVFGLVGAVLVLVAIDLWLAVTVVEVTNGSLISRTSVLGTGRTRQLDVSDIEDVTLGIGMTQSESVTQAAKAWYDISIHRRAGSKLKIGRHIADRREAEYVVGQLKRALRLPDTREH